jgi:hypothetical protein
LFGATLGAGNGRPSEARLFAVTETRGYGGDYVELCYRYKSNSERFQGSIKKPYIYPNYADGFVRHYPVDREIKVRVNPESPAQSFPILG